MEDAREKERRVEKGTEGEVEYRETERDRRVEKGTEGEVGYRERERESGEWGGEG